MKLVHSQGKAAEDLACQHLQQQNCKIIARNWHCAFGEIDIIAQHKQTLLFIEVKYRKNKQFGGAAYSITPAKLGKMQRSAEYYLQQNKLKNTPCRLDAVLIDGNATPQWIQNITG